LTLAPKRGFALAVLTNADAGGSVTKRVTKRALQAYLGLERPEPEPLRASEEELAAFVGRYSRPMADLELGMLAGRLIGQVTVKAGFPTEDAPIPPLPLPAPLDLCGKDRLLVTDGPMKGTTVDVLRQADGSIGWVRSGGRLHRRVG
jgi:hypothetical protein